MEQALIEPTPSEAQYAGRSSHAAPTGSRIPRDWRLGTWAGIALSAALAALAWVQLIGNDVSAATLEPDAIVIPADIPLAPSSEVVEAAPLF